jgi:hypothetical protein
MRSTQTQSRSRTADDCTSAEWCATTRNQQQTRYNIHLQVATLQQDDAATNNNGKEKAERRQGTSHAWNESGGVLKYTEPITSPTSKFMMTCKRNMALLRNSSRTSRATSSCTDSSDNRSRNAVYLSFQPMAKKRMHALKGHVCRKRVAAASSPAATCKQGVALTSPAAICRQGAALTSPARNACGCTRPSRARLCHRNSETLSDGSKTYLYSGNTNICT